MIYFKIYTLAFLLICLPAACAKPLTSQTWKIQKMINHNSGLVDTIDFLNIKKTKAEMLKAYLTSSRMEDFDETFVKNEINQYITRFQQFRLNLHKDSNFIMNGDPKPFLFIPIPGWHLDEGVAGTWKRNNDQLIFTLGITDEVKTELGLKEDITWTCKIIDWNDEILKLRVMDNGSEAAGMEVWFEKG